MKAYILLIINIIPLILFSQSQTNNEWLMTKSKYDDEGVYLKFMPKDPIIWLEASRNGYIIERQELGVDDNPISITKKPVLPFRGDDWNIINNSDSIRFNQEKYLWKTTEIKEVSANPIEFFRFSEELKQLYGLYSIWTTQNRKASIGSGMEYIDRNVSKNTFYRYIISLKTENNTIYKDTIDLETRFKGLNIVNLEVEKQELAIKMSWMHNPNELNILSYFVEKSIDGKKFDRISETPIFFNHENIKSVNSNNGLYPVFFKDSLEVNYVDVYYRLVGIDPWGQLSNYSDVIKTHGVDLTPPHKIEKLITDVDQINNAINLKWSYNNLDSDFLGYIIFHSNTLSGKYEMISQNVLAKDIKSFSHIGMNKNLPHYYRIGTIDKYGNYNMSDPKYVFVPDSKPPTSPVKIVATVDMKGFITLKWQENKELDLKGYSIYASNNKNHHFTNITPTPIKENEHVDKVVLERLDHYRYYKIKAIDLSFNFSEFSELVKVELPDIVAPASGRIKKAVITDGNVVIQWVKSPNDDIKKYLLFRKDSKTAKWVKIKEKDLGDNSDFIDELNSFGNYRYAIKAQDNAGNISKLSFSKSVKFKATKSIENIDLNVFNENDIVNISWKNSGSFNKILVYRSVNSGKFKMIKSVFANSSFKDNITTGNQYAYYIKGQTKEGKLSKSSNIKELKN